MVGHSMSAGLAGLYASAHPVSGLVMVDQGMEIRPFAELLHRHDLLRTQPADLESVLEAAPQQFESPILGCLRLRVDHVVQHQGTVNDPG